MLSTAGREPERWYRRFDLPLHEKLPDLADICAMPILAKTSRTHFASYPQVKDLAMALLASNFYFELRCMPVYENQSYICYGRILSLISVENKAFVSLIQRLDTLGAHFMVQGRVQWQKRPTILTTDHLGNFCKPIVLCVDELKEQVDVQLRFADGRSYSISANPREVQSFIKLQKLDWVSYNRSVSLRSGSQKKRQRQHTGKGSESRAIKKRRCSMNENLLLSKAVNVPSMDITHAGIGIENNQLRPSLTQNLRLRFQSRTVARLVRPVRSEQEAGTEACIGHANVGDAHISS